MKKDNKNKAEIKAQKIAARNSKAALKAEARQERRHAKLDPSVAAGFSKEKLDKDKSKINSSKKKKEKVNFKVALLEFPVKMLKDISRIKWVGKGTLGKRFILVVLFLIFFAIAYFIVDEILLTVFKSIKFI